MKKYTLATIYKGVEQVMHNLQPMTHKQACTMKSKFSAYAGRTIILKEVK